MTVSLLAATDGTLSLVGEAERQVLRFDVDALRALLA
jgi:hypothetical protein